MQCKHYLTDVFSMQIILKVLIDLLAASRTFLKSPEILLILLTCPLLQEDSSVIKDVLPLAYIITDMNEKNRTMLSKQPEQTLFGFCHRFGEIGSVHVNVKYKMSMYVCKYRDLLYSCIFCMFLFRRRLVVFPDTLHVHEADHGLQKSPGLHADKWPLGNSQPRSQIPTGSPQTPLQSQCFVFSLTSSVLDL